MGLGVLLLFHPTGDSLYEAAASDTTAWIVVHLGSLIFIPLLMDLPVIGKLFRSETERENKRDLLIMVTPHIVRD